MDRFWFLIGLTFLFGCNSGQKQKVLERWGNGKSKVVLTYDSPKDTLTYLRESFYESGKLFSKGHFQNNRQEGVWVWWYENGNKKDEATLKQGSYIGERKHWFENGKIMEIEIISGKCLSECCDGKVITYYSNGQIESESTMLNGRRNGSYIYRYDNGLKKKEEYFNAGLKEGKYSEWYSDGARWVEGNYKADKQDSVWTWYDSVGTITSIQIYSRGEFIRKIK